MSQPTPATKYVTPGRLLLDAVLVAAFFAYMFKVLRSHVPSNDEGNITLWAALAAACMSGVFWLCIQMFRVVYLAQKAANKKE